MSDIERLCEESIKCAVKPGDDHYCIIKMLDMTFSKIDDSAIQRIIANVDNQDLSLAMIPLSGIARKKVFNSMSGRLSEMIFEDMAFIGPVRLSVAGEACEAVFAVILKLFVNGEIYYDVDDSELLKDFAGVFLNDQEGKKMVG